MSRCRLVCGDTGWSTVLYCFHLLYPFVHRIVLLYIISSVACGVWRVACGVAWWWRGSTVRDGCEDKEGRVCDGMCWNGWMLVLALEDG